MLTGLGLPSSALHCHAATLPRCLHACDRFNAAAALLAVATCPTNQPPTSASACLPPPAPPQCTNENTGAPRAGCSAFKALKEQFDDSYFGNRAPTQILIHTPYLQRK